MQLEELNHRLKEVAVDLDQRIRQELAFPAVVHFYSWLLQGTIQYRCRISGTLANGLTLSYRTVLKSWLFLATLACTCDIQMGSMIRRLPSEWPDPQSLPGCLSKTDRGPGGHQP